MKKHLLPSNKILIVLILGLSLFLPQKALSGEFLIMNGTYTFTENNGGMFANAVYPPFNSSIPTNWLYPDDYWNGSFHAYYEVISVPTNEPFGFQMGIFQYIYPNDGKNFRETCSLIIPPLQGVGDWVDVNYGAPANWWQHPNGAADFSRPYDFQSIGPCVWSLVPGARGGLYPTAWGGDDAAWALRANWFPCTVRIIIVAVSSGSTFSGWSNYMGGGCSVPVQPGTISGNTNPSEGASETYSISAVSGATSYTWTLPSGWTGSSTTSSITATVGSNSGTIYVTANNGCGASTARSLAVTVGGSCVPTQLPTPTYGINYSYEMTNKAVPSTDEYAYNPNMSGAVSGTGSYLHLTPGTDVYFRTKANGACYLASNIQHLVVPARTAVTPYYTIDYINERTNENVSSTVAYSTSPSYTSPVDGTGARITLTPGQDLYFWVKETSSSFASLTFHLTVPARPPIPAITIDYNNEVTSTVSSSQEWSANSSMTSAAAGTNAALAVTPGTNLYIRTKPTASTFASLIQTLIVPNRPATPVYEINYALEKTNTSVPATDEYSTHSDMSSPSAGPGAALTLTPGTDLYFRTKYTASSFRSLIQHLVVGARPATPSFHIDYANETTSETVASNIEYAASADMASAAPGTGVKLPLTPGVDLYFRVKATASSFASMSYQLDVPARPTLEYTGADTVTSATITMRAILDAGMTGFDLTDLAVTNGQAQNLRAGNYFDVIGEAKGDVTVIIQNNKFGGASFASNEVVVYYNKTTTGISELTNDNFIVYPNPSSQGIIYIRNKQNIPYSIDIYSVDGELIKTLIMKESENQQIDLQNLTKGIYFLKLFTKDNSGIYKVILE